MDCSTAKCYSHDRDSYPCPQGYIVHAITKRANPQPQYGYTEAQIDHVVLCRCCIGHSRLTHAYFTQGRMTPHSAVGFVLTDAQTY